MSDLIDRLLTRDEFVAAPPVLIDIGASGEIHGKWRALAKHSICIAFDPDAREMGHVANASSGYKRLHVYPAIASATPEAEQAFYLTRSPFCSSTLQPDMQALDAWSFAELFSVERETRLPATTLRAVLTEVGLGYVDWFKTDSQGTDLRLFQSLGEELLSRVLIAEFEPGILDAYRGEDKLFQVLAFMQGRNFWMSDLTLRGTQRLGAAARGRLSAREHRYLDLLLRKSPGWGEIVYLNTMTQAAMQTQRDYLLAWIFSYLERQYGFCLDLAIAGQERFADPVFQDLESESLRALRRGFRDFPVYFGAKVVRRLKRLFGE